MNRFGLAAILAIAALIAIIVGLRLTGSTSPQAANLAAARRGGCSYVRKAFQQHASGQFLTISATVSRLLPDSTGIRVHQRFVVSCPAGQTVLITNDISIGKRAPVAVGTHVVVSGQYIWNSEGGLIHFTHHDPAGGQGGWIYVDGKLYSVGQTGLPLIMMSSPSFS